MAFSFFGRRREKPSPLLSPLLVSVLFGFAAGAVGMIVAAAYALPSQEFGATILSVPRGRVVPEDSGAPSIERAAKTIVAFHAKKAPEAGGVLDGAYLPSKAIAFGFVVTTDGWIVVSEAGAGKIRRLPDAIAYVDGGAYPVTETVSDPYSGLAFVRIAAAGLAVTPIAEASTMQPGESAYAFDGAGGLLRLNVVSYAALPATDPAGLVRSSERIERYLRLSSSSAPGGAMVMNVRGEAVAVVGSTDEKGTVTLPIEAAMKAVGGVFRERRTQRPYFGVRYVDLESAPIAGGWKGAFVTSSPDGTVSAVARRSPAAVAGIAADDVILSVNGEEVSAKHGLAELIAQYAPGTTVTLEVGSMSRNATRRVDAVLGTAP